MTPEEYAYQMRAAQQMIRGQQRSPWSSGISNALGMFLGGMQQKKLNTQYAEDKEAEAAARAAEQERIAAEQAQQQAMLREKLGEFSQIMQSGDRQAIMGAVVRDPQIAEIFSKINGSALLKQSEPEAPDLTQSYNPDGTITWVPKTAGLNVGVKPSSGGPDVNVYLPSDKQELTKPQQSKVQGQAVDAEAMLANLDVVGDAYKSEYLTYQGQAKGFIARQTDKFGVATEDQEKYLKGRRAFTETVDQIFNAYRSEITGAAASIAEIDRLKNAMLNSDLSPAEFESSLNSFRAKVKRDLTRYRELLNSGLTVEEAGAALDAELPADAAQSKDEQIQAAFPQARQAPDGEWYVEDPPGQFNRVAL
jgi:hypothetical protein